MLINEVIRNAESDSAIYYLLAAYMETTQFGAKLPDYLTNLPIAGMEDVETRFQQLMAELDKASERIQEKSRVVFEEALHIFYDALCRLKVLEREKKPVFAFHLLEYNVTNSPRRNSDSFSRGIF